MSKSLRNLGTGALAAVSVIMITTGTALAAAPQQTQPGSNVFDNLLLVVIGGALLALFAALASGTIIAVVAVGVSKFFHRNLPTDEEMAELQASLKTTSGPRPRFSVTPSAEPFVIAAAGFIVFFAVSSVVLAAAPKPVKGNPEAAKPAKAGLPKEGDFTKIVAGLPPGDPARGSKLYVSSGCSSCHSLEKGKRLVGPSFYDVFDDAKTEVKGMGPKEYIYQSVVSPNAFVVNTFQPNIMPQTFANQLSPQQISDIIAWMEKEHQGQP